MSSPDPGTISRDPAVDDLSALVESLRRRAVAAGARCAVLETHISCVLLAGAFAYKFKKPVDFGFVDFTTLARRKHFCAREVELNRRFAPELYLGVAAVTGTREAPCIDGANGAAVIEYAVKMQRFDDAARGDRLLERDGVSAADIAGLATMLAACHARAAIAPAGSDYGSPAAIRRQLCDNLDSLIACDGHAGRHARYRELRSGTLARLARLEDVFARRREEGFIRDCHGDLHLSNIVHIGGRLVPFDCLEFNDALRVVDVLADVAFLVMDLDLRDRHCLANRFLNCYLEASADYAGLTVLRVYLAYRSLVRAKVAVLQGQGGTHAVREGGELEGRIERHLALTECYHEAAPAPVLYLMHGVSGSGKSAFSAVLADRAGAIRCRSDIERKRLGAGDPPAPRDVTNTGLYTRDMNRRTYECLRARATTILAAGYSAVMDATFLQRSDRADFIALAEQLGAPWRIVYCRADDATLRERVMARRDAGGDPSDATIEVLDAQRVYREALSEAELARTITIDTTDERDLERQLNALLADAQTRQPCP